MFGYISINKPELKFREYDEYRGFYCGLCHSLKRHGQFSRLTLNFDMTFLAILLTDLYEAETNSYELHCPIHPLKKERVYENKYLDYCADMTIILAYFKNEDDIKDERMASSKLGNLYLAKRFKEISGKYEAKIQRIREALDEISNLEASKSREIDYLASSSGKMLGEVFRYEDDHWAKQLYQMGFYLGKYVYLLDAYDDRNKDKKKGCFNIINEMELDKDKVLELLEMMMAEAAERFEVLPILDYAGIMRNVIYADIAAKMDEIDKRMEKK